MDMMTIVGLPFSYMNRLYNVAAVVFHGEVICLIPKTFIPNYSEFYEARHFTAAPKEGIFLHMPELCDEEGLDLIWFGSKTLFQADNMPGGDLRGLMDCSATFYRTRSARCNRHC